jgi:hypothetical protein
LIGVNLLTLAAKRLKSGFAAFLCHIERKAPHRSKFTINLTDAVELIKEHKEMKADYMVCAEEKNVAWKNENSFFLICP